MLYQPVSKPNTNLMSHLCVTAHRLRNTALYISSVPWCHDAKGVASLDLATPPTSIRQPLNGWTSAYICWRINHLNEVIMFGLRMILVSQSFTENLRPCSEIEEDEKIEVKLSCEKKLLKSPWGKRKNLSRPFPIVLLNILLRNTLLIADGHCKININVFFLMIFLFLHSLFSY